MKTSPPKYIQRFLKWFCEEDLYEEIRGDLDEAFYDRLKVKGPGYARRMYILDVLKFFKPYSWKKFKPNKQRIPMLKNYLKIALRNIFKRKEYAALNAVGLTIGLCCIIFSILYLRNELRHDRFFANSEDIYRIQRTYRSQEYAVVPLKDYWNTAADDQLNYVKELNNWDEVANAIQLTSTKSPTSFPQYYVRAVGKDRIVEQDIVWTNSGNEFFSIFNLEFLVGSSQKAFSQTNRILLTEDAASKYFDTNWRADENLLSKSLIIDSIEYQIDGVVQDLPPYTHFTFDLLVNKEALPSWGSYVYVKKNSSFDESKLQQAVSQAYQAFKPESKDDPLEKGVSLLPLTEIYMDSNALYELKPPGDSRYLWIFAIIAAIILIITVTNYFNLSVALYADRHKEIGVRKVLGATKRNTIVQFLLETLLISFLCLPLSLLIVHLTLPYFNDIMGTALTNDFIAEPILLLGAIALTGTIGLLSGLYPSVILSRQHIVGLFKNKLNSQTKGFGLRRLLVGFQFILLIGLVSATFFINQQLSFLLTTDLGFQKEGVVSINVGDADTYMKMKNELLQNRYITQIGSGGMPGNEMYNTLTYKMLEANESNVRDDGTNLVMDRGAMEVLGIKHQALQTLSEDKSSIFLINQTAADVLAQSLGGSPSELIGQTFQLEPEYDNIDAGTQGIHYTIDGIIPDYHYFTLKEKVNPMFIEVRETPEWAYQMLFKISTDNLYEALSAIETEYDQYHPNDPIHIEFLDDKLSRLYKNEQQAASLISALSTIAVVLSILGLIGLVSFIIKSKEQEIGIRKVFGANIKHILISLNKDFSVVALLATVIAAPISLWAVDRWLLAFAYRIDTTWIVFLIAGVICLLITVLVVSIQAMGSINKNAIDTLREKS